MRKTKVASVIEFCDLIFNLLILFTFATGIMTYVIRFSNLFPYFLAADIVMFSIIILYQVTVHIIERKYLSKEN